MFYIVGLGNPGKEYEISRHNAGRIAVLSLLDYLKINDRELNKKADAIVANGKIKNEKIIILLPETYMNKSGKSISYFLKPKEKKTKKGIDNLIVVHDDIDLPIGTIKISYNKGTGGHKGLESIVKHLKTKEFVRIRIGVIPKTAGGKLKKPSKQNELLDFILGNFRKTELDLLNNNFDRINKAIETIVEAGRDKAMNLFN